jgi:hypothetical protein
MRLKMLVSLAGADFTVDPGQETDRFAGEEATRLIAAGYAVPAAGADPETAAVSAPAETTRRRGPRRAKAEA